MARPYRTQDSIKTQIEGLFPNMFDLTDLVYTDSRIPISMVCKDCGETTTKFLKSIISSPNPCDLCRKKAIDNQYSIENIQKWLDKSAKGYKVIKSYERRNLNTRGSKRRVVLTCPNPKHEPYDCDWVSFKSGFRCSECKKGTRWTKQKVIDFYKKKGLTVIEEIKSIKTDSGVKCKDKEGYTVYPSITNLKRGSSPSIIQMNPSAYENILTWTKNNRPDYRLFSRGYEGHTDLLLEWEYLGEDLPEGEPRNCSMTLNQFMNARRVHPSLIKSKSKAELITTQTLEKLDICFEKEKTFEGCKDVYKLRFDFFLPKYNLVIECHGKQHYEENNYFGGYLGFLGGQNRDNIKQRYCEEQKIKFVEIPYWEFGNISSIVESLLVGNDHMENKNTYYFKSLSKGCLK